MLTDACTHTPTKADLYGKVAFHKKNVILQSIASTLWIIGCLYASQRKSVYLPFILAPSTAASLTKLEKHRRQQRFYQEQLKNLERN